jgi:hypothetical protein
MKTTEELNNSNASMDDQRMLGALKPTDMNRPQLHDYVRDKEHECLKCGKSPLRYISTGWTNSNMTKVCGCGHWHYLSFWPNEFINSNFRMNGFNVCCSEYGL